MSSVIQLAAILAAILCSPGLDIGKDTTVAALIASTAARVKRDGSPGPTPTRVKDASNKGVFFNSLINYAFLVDHAKLTEFQTPLLLSIQV